MSRCREEHIHVNDLRTRIVRGGAGPAVVLVHGLGGPLMWQRVIEPLAEKTQVVMADLPGFGGTDCPRNPYTTSDYVSFLSGVMDVLETDHANLVGISYGGQIVARLAACFPERVDTIVLVSATGLSGIRLLRRQWMWKLFFPLVAHLGLRSRWLIQKSSDTSFYDLQRRPEILVDEFVRQMAPKERRLAWANCLKNIFCEALQVRSDLSQITRPTLVVWGAEDRTVPPRFAYKFQRHIRNSRLSILDQCAHSVPLEKPMELRDLIVRFISSTNISEQVNNYTQSQEHLHGPSST